MLLSALHVSTPMLAYKHWLYGVLYALNSMQEIMADHYLQRLEHLARQFVYGRFLNSGTGADYYHMIYKNGSYPLFLKDNQ
ncbi:hypothetical protein [Snodgrassella gandavensis]|uniref:hypothetical protein n=1 Tax=Snodgrassella gandavensis TaxID=2946698 RepID=UPI001EF65E0D|nr:hypothetical protein [Snodgrassella gandavensis]